MFYIVLIISCLAFIVLALYFFFYPSKGIQRIRHLEEVKQTYAKQIIGPKRLIVGGSDVLYSFNTDVMNRELVVPTVNFGTNVGLGMGYLLDFAKAHLNTGDQVILCLAYSLYFKKPYDIFSYEYYRMYDRKKIRRFSLKDQFFFFFANLKLNISYVQKQFKLSSSGAYIEVRGCNFESRKNKPLKFPEYFEETESLKKLKEFKNYCKEKKIDIKLTFPSTLYFAEYKNSTYLQELFKFISTEFYCIDSPDSYFVPKIHIYNSVYHVNELGQSLRTKNLIQYLKCSEEKV
ncbi:hypothetical protein COD78_28340 [Bacillus cereus]|uniref:hypothetical protein n=1 Tax=Bacillus cereus TaxID=1396 RepID=UPI000BF43188|nr:hypothetical protein [Bacillus cereus]PEX06319.1 hypothetical protein CN454_28845 [Bacillus cereus]PGV18305.1 hypothetical protein COD78_28340 [Bacillus cereus]